MQATMNKLFFRAVLAMVALVIVFGVLIAGNADIEEIRKGPPQSSAVVLEAGLTNPIMAEAYEQLKASGQIGDETGEAHFTMPTADGSVELTRSDIGQLNSLYRLLKAQRAAASD